MWSLGHGGSATKRLKHFSTMTVFSSVLYSCSDYNALLFCMCVCVYIYVCLFVWLCAGTMALCLTGTEADARAALHSARGRRQTGWNPAQFTSPALHRQPRWNTQHDLFYPLHDDLCSNVLLVFMKHIKNTQNYEENTFASDIGQHSFVVFVGAWFCSSDNIK